MSRHMTSHRHITSSVTSHHTRSRPAGSHGWFFRADLARLCQLTERVQRCPLGSGALAGNPFAVDRHQLAADLGFSGVTPNSMHAVSDRDYIGEWLGVSVARCQNTLITLA